MTRYVSDEHEPKHHFRAENPPHSRYICAMALHISTPQDTLHFLYDATGRKWAKSACATAPADESGPEGLRW